MQVEILGTEYECHPLSATDRKAWSQYVHYEVLRTFYSDLHSRVESLPMPLQVAVFQKESPPKRVDPWSPDYYRVASTPAAVRFLLDMVLIEDACPIVDELDGHGPGPGNAAEILLALRELIFPPPRPTVDQEAAQDTFAKLERENDGG
ncbi:MAG: hypothetical protein V3U39_12355 [Acidimicrobiia bacterium]